MPRGSPTPCDWDVCRPAIPPLSFPLLAAVHDLEQLLAMLKEVEDYAEANGSEEPADDQDAEPAPA